MHLHLKVAASGRQARARVLETLRREIREIDGGLPVLELKTLRDHLDGSLDLWVEEAGARILGTFGVIALLLAVIGLYGVRVFTVGAARGRSAFAWRWEQARPKRNA
jgi:putative ABC transport system permease protein